MLDGFFAGLGATTRRLAIRIVEARIAEVRLDGQIGPAATQVRSLLNHLVQAGPINQAPLERWLLLVQDMPRISIRAVSRWMKGLLPLALVSRP